MRNQLFGLFIFLSIGLVAQQQETFENLNNFKDQSGNWMIVGDVTMNRNIDVHHKPTTDQTGKKKKKKKKEEPVAPKAVDFSAGTGILLNINNEAQKDALFTKWEHEDIKLELEVMLPKGSNSGIYFQGRYELQLFDSWGVKNPKYSDIGGIYRNWEQDPAKIFRGIAPSSNAAKAPGLWQKLKIHFQAPRFNEAGEKIANAKFVSVDLNGVRIHSNVEVPTYTGGQISKQEASRGPLMIQGDHGPVAIKNFKYQLLKESDVTMSTWEYKTYKGAFKGLEQIDEATAVLSGNVKELDVNVTGEEDEYGVVYSGTLNIEKDDNYAISVGYTGGVKVLVDGKVLGVNNSSSDQAVLKKEISLSKGAHAVQITNIKSAGWRAARLGFFVESATTNPVAFHAYDSYPPSINSTSPIFVDAGSQPRMLRAFVAFKGNEKRLSHTIGVATPAGLNFVYDLSSANVVGVWRGDFVDATPMWHNRGDGSFRPRGAVQWTFLNQSIAQLESENSPFPETGNAPDFVSKGYVINSENKLPIFKHTYKDVSVENSIVTDGSNTYFIREVKFSKTGLSNWYMKLASGSVKKMQDGSYAIGDQAYYIKVLSGQIPKVREVNGESELILPIDGSSVKYEIIW